MRWAVQELNLPKANYEFAASTARPTAHFTAKITQQVAVNLPIQTWNSIEFVVGYPNDKRRSTRFIGLAASPIRLHGGKCQSDRMRLKARENVQTGLAVIEIVDDYPKPPPMKLNVTIVFTVALLFSMFAAGLMSAAWGFALGREALKGITQPDVRPTNNLIGAKDGKKQGDSIQFVSEEKILEQVQAQVKNKSGQ
jgi:hypothetical protein